MDVEALAVSKISSMIARCPHLKAFISTNDKTPFTDGYIDLHIGLLQSKADWRGRVPVQVKGRTLAPKKTSLETYPITRTDLLAYQRDSGVLYFVVAVDPKTSLLTPYYALLSPFAIESILNRVSGGKRHISVPLKIFPNDSKSIESLVWLALRTRDQRLSLGFDPVLFERAQSLTLYTASGLDFDRPVTLATGSNDFALVLNTTEGLSIPLGGELRIFPQDYLKRSVDVHIHSGEITYKGAAIKRNDEDTIEVEVSEGLKLLLQTESGRQSIKVSLTLERTLSDRLKSFEFYTALLDTGVIEFNENPLPFNITTSDEDTELREHLKTLHALTDLFDHLGVDTHLIDMGQISEVQTRQLNVLHRAFVQNNEITDASAETSRVLQQVGPWALMLLISPGSAPDKWRFIDPFSTEVRQQFRSSSIEEGEQEPIPVTAYDIVEDEHLGTVLNMRLDAIVGAYQAIADFPSTYDLANQRVLALITASDASEFRKVQLLEAAASLNEWLVAEQSTEPHHLINRWQISTRRCPLSTDQRSDIRRLKRQIAHSGANNADQLELACALLLGDKEEVEDLVGHIPVDRLDQMRKWPIWRLRDGRAETDRPAI